MCKVSKALAEVWEWKARIYEERKDMTLAQWAKASIANSGRIREKYGIKRSKETAKTKKVTSVPNGPTSNDLMFPSV